VGVRQTMKFLVLIHIAFFLIGPAEAQSMENLNDIGDRFDCNSVSERTVEVQQLTIHVLHEHCVESLGPDSSGKFVYHYEYDVYRFSNKDSFIKARSYAIEPDEAHFLEIKVNGNRRMLEPSDCKNPFVKAAIQYLQELGKSKLTWLDRSNTHDGYSKVPKPS